MVLMSKVFLAKGIGNYVLLRWKKGILIILENTYAWEKMYQCKRLTFEGEIIKNASVNLSLKSWLPYNKKDSQIYCSKVLSLKSWQFVMWFGFKSHGCYIFSINFLLDKPIILKLETLIIVLTLTLRNTYKKN